MTGAKQLHQVPPASIRRSPVSCTWGGLAANSLKTKAVALQTIAVRRHRAVGTWALGGLKEGCFRRLLALG